MIGHFFGVLGVVSRSSILINMLRKLSDLVPNPSSSQAIPLSTRPMATLTTLILPQTLYNQLVSLPKKINSLSDGLITQTRRDPHSVQALLALQIQQFSDNLLKSMSTLTEIVLPPNQGVASKKSKIPSTKVISLTGEGKSDVFTMK